MRTIKSSTQFKKDYKRVSRGQYRSALSQKLAVLIDLLARDLPLPPAARDHALTGNKRPYRECHVKPDLLLMYGKSNAEELLLVRLGSHSELNL